MRAYNSNYHSAIKMEPDFALFGYVPQVNWTNEIDKVPAADHYANKAKQAQNLAKEALKSAQHLMKKHADKH